MRLSVVPIDTPIHIDFTIVDPATGQPAGPTSMTAYVLADDADTPSVTLPSSAVVQRSAVGHYRCSFTPAISSANLYQVGASYQVIIAATVSGVTARAPIANFILGPARYAGAVLAQYAGNSTTEFGVSVDPEATPRTIVDASAFWRSSRVIYGTGNQVTDVEDSVSAINLAANATNPTINSDGVLVFPGTAGAYLDSGTAQPELVAADGFTLGFRFQLDSLAATNPLVWLYDTGVWEYYVSVSTAGAMSIGLDSADTADITSTTFTTGTWYTILIVYDGTQTGNSNRLKAWVNGSASTLSYAVAVPASIVERTGASFSVGGRAGLVPTLAGKLSQIYFSQRPATSAEVTALNSNFVTSRTDMFENALVTFTSGALKGQVRKITAYNPTYERVTVYPPLTTAPTDGDKLMIVNQ